MRKPAGIAPRDKNVPRYDSKMFQTSKKRTILPLVFLVSAAVAVRCLPGEQPSVPMIASQQSAFSLVGQDSYPSTFLVPSGPSSNSPTSSDTLDLSPRRVAEQPSDASDSGTDLSLFEKRLDALEKELKELERRPTKSSSTTYPTLKLRGHILIDAAAFSQDNEDRERYDEQDGVDIAVARIIGEGNIAENAGYKLEFDYVKNTIGDLYFEFRELPYLHNLRLGYMKEPFSLEQLLSPKYTITMDRAFARVVHPQFRRIGVLSYDTWGDERGTWAIGLFADGLSSKVQDDRFGGAITGRITWLPWADRQDVSRNLLHLGMSYSYRRPFAEKTRFWASSGSLLGSRILDTRELLADDVHLLGTELAFVRGPFSIVTEWNLAWVKLLNGQQADVNGCYTTIGYFLTGESRQYSTKTGLFGKVVPNHDVWWFSRPPDSEKQSSSGLGWGAWELLYRYSYGDAFDDGILPGGQAASHTVGINWYPNAFTRVAMETIAVESSPNWGKPDGHLQIFQIRTQVEF